MDEQREQSVEEHMQEQFRSLAIKDGNNAVAYALMVLAKEVRLYRERLDFIADAVDEEDED